MPDPARIAGIVEVAYNGNVIKVTGNIGYNLGAEKREGLVGPDSVHGYKAMPQIPFIEGTGRIVSGFDLREFVNISQAEVTAKLANDVIVTLRKAYYAGDGTAGSENAEIPFKFEGESAEIVGA